MKRRRFIRTGIALMILLVFGQNVFAEIWQDPARMSEWSGRQFFGIVAASALTGSGTLQGFVDYAVYAPGDYTGSVSFDDDLYVYTYQVTNYAGSTVGIDYFSAGLPPDVEVPNVAYDPAKNFAIPGGSNPTMHFKLPESVIYLYLTDNIGPGEHSMTLLFSSSSGPGGSYGYVSGGAEGGENVPLPAPVPEPATLGLFIGGALLAFKRSRNKYEKKQISETNGDMNF